MVQLISRQHSDEANSNFDTRTQKLDAVECISCVVSLNTSMFTVWFNHGDLGAAEPRLQTFIVWHNVTN